MLRMSDTEAAARNGEVGQYVAVISSLFACVGPLNSSFEPNNNQNVPAANRKGFDRSDIVMCF